MTKENIEEMLNNIGIEYRYHHFETEEAIEPPFMVWLIPGYDNFPADGMTYYSAAALNIELYTDFKDFGLESEIENVLNRYEIFWDKKETYIESENMYEVLYEMEV